MPMSDWQSPAAYEHAQDIAAAGMAWEYLRRDDEYRRAFQRTKTLAASKPGGQQSLFQTMGFAISLSTRRSLLAACLFSGYRNSRLT
ncbi:transcriptional regulator domain-containing protein [Gluconacetobacter sacchari]|uniref:transcriptional regulator domain-containing protein n=1 Tax=Gluconacetobacter sacchari TaxID=92759 RepID=UPI0039B3E58C